jgi:hypothetical protein
MAAVGRCGELDLFSAEPVVQHPLIGHADSDVLVNFPKFDCIEKSTVLTKAGATS